ncbi:MAG: hypothetical protein IH624_11295, partial [Phycisphaerae bacterium]|nr:hypothetical protein [Phycisphaerae bacterium]
MKEENVTGGLDTNERPQADAAAYRLPPDLGRYYKMLMGCCTATPLAAAFLSMLAFPFIFILSAALPCFAILCFVSGVIALVRVRRSRGALQGNGYVMPTIVMPLLLALSAISIAAGIGAGARTVLEHIYYPDLRNLREALTEFRNDNGGCLPPANQWCDVLESTHNDLFYEMQDDKFVTRYALNTGATEVKGQLPNDMVLLFTSEQGWNLAGGPELMPRRFRGQVVSVYLAGGAVELVRARDAATLRWAADDPPAGRKPASFSDYAALGGVIAAFCGAVILHFRRHLRSLGFAALGVGALSAAAGALCGFAAEGLYSVKGDMRLGSIAGAAIGLLAGFCFVLLLGYGRDRMRPG